MSALALDIGGANIKAAHATGGAWSIPFALWKDPSKLADKLREAAAAAPPFNRLLVTMTAELCDCFETKRAGVNHVLDAVETLAGKNTIGVWTTDGRFVAPSEARREPIKAAASNWHALATHVATLYPDGFSLMVDTGSTTTDIIRLRDGKPNATGLTDMARLESGELIYIGARRTSLMALGTAIEWRGKMYGVMAEHFATTADAFLLTGDLVEQPDDRETADGRPMTAAFAAARVARMIGADLEMITLAEAKEVAEIFSAIAGLRVAASMAKVVRGAKKSPSDPDVEPTRIIVSGSGDFLGEFAAEMVFPAREIVKLTARTGAAASTAACAYALLQLDKP